MSDRICHKCPPTDNPPELCEHNTISKEELQKLLPNVDLDGYEGPFTLGTDPEHTRLVDIPTPLWPALEKGFKKWLRRGRRPQQLYSSHTNEVVYPPLLKNTVSSGDDDA